MTHYKPWFERYPERFAEERIAFEARGFGLDEQALSSRQAVVFEGASRIEPDRPLQVVFPESFPSSPPRVFSKTPGRMLVRHHRPGSWEICIFGPGQPRWSASQSGDLAVDEAEDVIAEFQPGSVPPAYDAVPEPWTEYYDYVEEAAILVPPFLTDPVSLPCAESMTGKVRVRYEFTQKGPNVCGRGVVLEASLNGTRFHAEEPFTHLFREQTEEWGQLVYTPTPPPDFADSEHLRTWLASLNLPRKKNKKEWIVCIFPEESGARSHFRLGWVALRVYPNFTFGIIRCYPYRSEERAARVPDHDKLAEKTVVFVGAGSLGSRIAVALAAAGLQRMGIVDDDLYDPQNAVRHEGGVFDFGRGKARVLADRLVHVNPLTYRNVDILPMYIGAVCPVDHYRKLVDMIAAADLVVDTTGSHAVSRYLDEQCRVSSTPILFASVTNGAWSGEIVRVIPGSTPCWLCWMTQYEDDRPPQAPTPVMGVFAPGCGQPTFEAAGYETSMVANLAAWVAVETLLREEPGRSDLHGHYLRWSVRGHDGIPDPQVQVLPVRSRDNCPICRAKKSQP